MASFVAHTPDCTAHGYAVEVPSLERLPEPPEGMIWTEVPGPAAEYSVELVEGVPVPVRGKPLERAKAEAVARIDVEAEACRLRFITSGAGQAMTYQRKEAEARAWTSGDAPSSAPFLAAEASATGKSIDDIAVEVIAAADQWAVIGAAIEGVRMGAKAAVAAADTAEAVDAALQIDWPHLGLANGPATLTT